MTKLKWRDVLQVHPSAEEFPSPKPEDFKKLKDSIRQQGMITKIIVWQAPDGEDYLLDGRSRLDALEALDLLDRVFEGPRHKFNATQVQHWLGDVDAAKTITASNIIRRHLTPKQQVDLARKVRTAATAFAKQVVHTKVQNPQGGRPKSEATQLAEDTGLHRNTTRKYIKQLDEEAAAVPEPKQPNPKTEVATLPTSDAHAVEVLKLLNKIDPTALSEKGWTKLDHAQERLSELYDIQEEAK